MMAFLDGPAAGESLACRRCPILLRVVRSRNGNWDALDQLEDEPKESESIFVYRIASVPHSMFLCIRGKGKAAGGLHQVADYKVYEPQPLEMQIRDNTAWGQWCESQRKRMAFLLHGEGIEIKAMEGAAT